MNKRVTAIGGVFFKSRNPQAICKWYNKHLGFITDDYGATFEWKKTENKLPGFSAWSPFKEDTNYFEPSQKEFMINFRVDNIAWLIETLKKEGVKVIGEIQQYDYGKFAHIIDCEGNKIELWEANDEEFSKILGTPTIK